MRRKNKEINIFSMSALDLFASAMGAFILIAVVALPYYLNTDKSLMTENEQLTQKIQTLENELQTKENELQECKSKVNQLEQDLEKAKKNIQSCQKKLKQTFIAVIMQWGEEETDVDLHVISPEGYEFYFKKSNINGADYPNSRAKLSRDTTRGPGVEVWEIPVAKQGKYKIYYKFYARNGGSSTVNIGGNIYTNKGSNTISTTRISSEGQKKLVATINVASNGDVNFE